MIRIYRIMKYLTTTLLIGLAGTFSLGFADDKKPAAPRGDGSFLQKIDKDGDKAISKEEAGERWERMSKLDKDGDGKVTMQEMMAARGDRPRPDGGPKGRPEPGAFFKRADKNEDGKISKDELPEQAWERMSKLDKNGDGAISKDEIPSRPDGPGRPPGKPGEGGPDRGEMLKRADKNGDGSISKDEVPEQAWERLGKLDKNEDGAVSKEEMAAGFKAMRGAGGGPGAGKPGAGRPGGGGPEAMFSRFDKDKDGKIAESEVPAEMWGKLRKADTDADGLVSKKELGSVYQARGDKDGDRPAKPRKKKDDEKDAT